MNHTPRLNLPFIHSGQAQKEITHNEALALLDVLINPVVQNIGVDVPPPEAQAGQLFIIGANPQGEFTTYPNAIAQKLEHGWQFVKPSKWLEVVIDADGSKHRWNGEYWMPSQNTPAMLSLEPSGVTRPNNMLINKKTGEYLKAGHLEEELTINGAYTDTNIQVPHHTIVIAVNVRVLEKIVGVDSFSVGIENDVVRYGSELRSDIDTTNIGLTHHPLTYWNNTSIRITASNGSFTGGRLHITIQYLQPHGAWTWD